MIIPLPLQPLRVFRHSRVLSFFVHNDDHEHDVVEGWSLLPLPDSLAGIFTYPLLYVHVALGLRPRHHRPMWMIASVT